MQQKTVCPGQQAFVQYKGHQQVPHQTVVATVDQIVPDLLMRRSIVENQLVPG
jgi:hypothetical protein